MCRLILITAAAALASGCSEQMSRDFDSGQSDLPRRFVSAGFVSDTALNTAEPNQTPEPAGVLTLEQALRLTLRNNPELKAYAEEIMAARARHSQAGQWENPELGLEIENIAGSGDYGGFDSAETTLQLSQLIELGGKVKKRQNAAAFGTRLAELDYEARGLDTLTEAAQAYIELLFIEKKQELADEFIEITARTADTINNRVQAGKDTPLDLSKARVAATKARLQRDQIERYEDYFRKKLASFWGSRRPRFTALSGRMEDITPIPPAPVLYDLLQNNPDTLRRAVEVQQSRAELALAKSRSIPDISVGAGARHFSDTDDTAFVFGFSIPLPIANQYRGHRLEALHNLNKTHHRREASLLNVWNECARLHADLRNAWQKASVMQNEILSVSQEVFTASQVSYEQGKIDYLSLLDAQRIYFESRNEYLDALAEYHLSKTRLERLLGRRMDDIH